MKLFEKSPDNHMVTHRLSNNSTGIGKQVMNTANNRKDFLPQASERAPIRGAQRNASIPWGVGYGEVS